MNEYFYNKKGEIAVLVSPGYGAGWSSWNSQYGIDLATDKRIVEKSIEFSKTDMLEKIDRCGSAEEIEFTKWLESIGYKAVYAGGFNQCVIEWVPKGTAIRISEYDGYESLETDYSGFVTL